MSVETQRRPGSYYLQRPPVHQLSDVMELILDKGLVIDAFVRVSLFGTELVTVDARMVIASIDTYLRFADAVSRLDLDPLDGNDRSGPSPNMTLNGAEDRGAMKVFRVRNGAPRGESPKPNLNGHARDAGKPARNNQRRASRKPHDASLAARTPGIGCVRPYDWKAATAADLLR